MPARIGRAAVVATVLTVGATACARDEAPLDAGDLELVVPGRVTVCSDVPQPPFVVADPDGPSGYSGFEIDLLQAITDDLGLLLEVKDVAFESIVSARAFGTAPCDIAASGISMTPDRAEMLAFTDVSHEPRQALLVAAGVDLDGLRAASGHRVGVQTATDGEVYVDANAPAGTEIVRFATRGDLFAALAAGTIEAAVHDLVVALEQVDEDAAVAETYAVGQPQAFALRSDRADGLVALVNTALARLHQDGRYDQIYRSYFGGDRP